MSLQYIKCPRCRHLRLELCENVCCTCWRDSVRRAEKLAERWRQSTEGLDVDTAEYCLANDHADELVGVLRAAGELLYWIIEYRTRTNGRWKCLDARHHIDVDTCQRVYRDWLFEEKPKDVRFRNTQTGAEVTP